MDKEQNKLKIIFDGSILQNYLNKNSCRSGILFVAVNILKELAKNNNTELLIYYQNTTPEIIQELKKINVIPSNCKIIPREFITNRLIEFLINLKQKIKKTKSNDNLIKKGLRFIINKILPIHFYNLKFNKKLISCLEKYDIYLSVCDPVPEFIRQNKKIHHYLLIHDLIPLVLKDFYNTKYKSHIQGMYNIIKTLNEHDKYFSVSEHTKKDIIKYFPKIPSDNIVVTHLGRNEEFFDDNSSNIEQIKSKYNIPLDKKYFLSLCTIEPRKNILFAVKNFIEFVNKYEIKDLVFVLSGDTWEEFTDNIKDFDKNLIKTTGYVDDEDINCLYSGALAFIYPSLYEGFGLPVLEAMQCGCPVISSNQTSLPEVTGNACLQINPYSDNDLIEGYKRMYFDENFRNTCSKNGLERAKTFSWEKCVNTMCETFYEDLEN